jgi:predicted P-loop ATPase
VPYGKAVESFPRRGIIVGTTNKTAGFLVDETGNRRFWVIPTTKTQQDQINTAALLLERDAIWSAAVKMYRDGESSRLPAAMEDRISEENDTYLIDSPWRSPIIEYLERRSGIELLTSEEILEYAIKKPLERQSRADQMQVASILKDLGWVKKREATGRRRWHYVQVRRLDGSQALGFRRPNLPTDRPTLEEFPNPLPSPSFTYSLKEVRLVRRLGNPSPRQASNRPNLPK